MVRYVTLILPSSFPSRAMNCATWDPNPPTEPSSTVIKKAWFSQSSLTSWMSRGLQNLASATVTLIPSSERSDQALRQFWTITPYPSRATSLPSMRTLPFPICTTSKNNCIKEEKSEKLNSELANKRYNFKFKFYTSIR